MHSKPFDGVYPVVEKILKELIPPDDPYHYKHLRRFARTLHVLLDNKPEGRLLEIGTSGVIPLALKELAPDVEVHVTNFDKSQPVLHPYAPRIGDRFGTFQGYMVDLEYDEIPEQDEFFDWVICCEVIEHMEIDPMFMLSEVNRVTKTNGHLLLTTPNATSTWAYAKILRGIEPYFYLQYNKDRSYHRHNYEYSIHSLATVLDSAGFTGSIWTEDAFEDGNYEIIHSLEKAGFPVGHVGDNIMTVAKKTGPVSDRHPKVIYV